MSGDESTGGGGPQIHCHICSATLPADATFCLQCGSRVRAVPPAPSSTAPAAAAPPPPTAAPRHATMLGVAPLVESPTSGATLREAHPAGALAAQPDAPAPAPPSPPAPAPAAEPTPESSASASGPLPTAVPNKQRTMIGVALDARALPPLGTSDPPPAQPAGPAAPPAGGRANTMMGVAPPVAQPTAAPAPAAHHAIDPHAAPSPEQVARRRKESPPFIGGQRLGAAPPPYVPHVTEDELRVPRRAPVGLWILGGLVVLGLLGGAGVLAMRALGARSAPSLQAEVRLADGALRVHATIPGADARWRVIHRGTEHPVDATGAVDFPLAGVDPDAVGDVVLPIDVRDGAGATSARTLHLVIGYRVVADLEHLGDDPPRVHLRFRVPAGATLTIARQRIALSGQVGVAEIPAPAPMPVESSTASRSERFPIEVRTASGVMIRGEYELRVPRLPLRVESPGPLSLVNGPMVTVEGSLARATRVLVGTQRATLTGDHFRAEVPIGPGANALAVQGFAPGGAPTSASLTVYRAVTPQDYLASGGGDRGVAPLVTPPANSVRLKVRGRVINSTQAAGELPTFQLLVSDRACPAQQCLAWVDAPAGTLVRVNETVEVVGETHGTRSYVTQTGQRRTDTVIRSLFLTRP